MQKYIRTIIEDIKYTRFDNTRKSRASEKSSSLEFLSKRKPHRIFRVAKNYRTRWKYISGTSLTWLSTGYQLAYIFRPAYCANRNFYRLCNYQPIVLLWQVPVQGKVIKNFPSTAHPRSIGSVVRYYCSQHQKFFFIFDWQNRLSIIFALTTPLFSSRHQNLLFRSNSISILLWRLLIITTRHQKFSTLKNFFNSCVACVSAERTILYYVCILHILIPHYVKIKNFYNFDQNCKKFGKLRGTSKEPTLLPPNKISHRHKQLQSILNTGCHAH